MTPAKYLLLMLLGLFRLALRKGDSRSKKEGGAGGKNFKKEGEDRESGKCTEQSSVQCTREKRRHRALHVAGVKFPILPS